MPDQQPIASPPPSQQQVPVIAPDLSNNPGAITDKPYQAPLPQVNTPLFSPNQGGGGQPQTLGQFFNSVKTPSDEKSYLSPEYTPQQLTKRYSTWNPYIDNEQKAAENQSSFARLGNGLLKFGATALGTLAESVMTIPDTISALRSGNLSSLYNSDLESATDNWLKNLEDEFPNYYSTWEKAHPFLSMIPFSGGFANFLSDKVIKNLGFTVGAIGGAVLQDTLVGSVTEGIGELPLIGAQIGKAALWINKLFSTETKLGEFLGATKPGILNELLTTGEAAGASKQAMFDLKKLAEMAYSKKVTDAARYGLNLYGAARTEGGFEARDGYNTVRQDLIDQFRSQHFREPNQNEIKEIEKYATAGANVRFGVNMAILSLSDAIQFDNILKPFNSAQKGITGSLQQKLGKAAIGIKEGTIDTFEKKLPTSIGGKIWNKIKPVIPNILAEGVYEEGGQYATQVATQNYYERKYYAEKVGEQRGTDKAKWGPDTVANVMHSTLNGLTAEFGSTEGLENIILGGLTAIITGGIEHFYDKFKGNSQHELNTTLSLLNNNSVTGLLSNMFGNAMKSGSVLSNMQAAVKNNDLFQYKNEQSRMFNNFILAHLQADRFDVALEKLGIAKDLPQGEFEKAFGIDKSDTAKKTASEYIDGLVIKATQIKNNYDAINTVFKNPYTLNRKPKDKTEAIEAEKYQKFEEWKYSLLEHTSDIADSNWRLGTIGATISQIHSGLTIPLLQSLTHPKELTSTQKAYEKQAENLEKEIKDKLDTHENLDPQIKAARDNAKLISEFLNSKTADERDTNFMSMFESLLNYKLNSEHAGEPTVEEVPKQVLPTLAKYGIDANKIRARKIVAQKAYDILTSEKGFDKYFSAMEKRQATSAKIEESYPIKAVDIDTENLTVPITIKGGEKIAFKEGESYPINIGTDANPEVDQLKYTSTDNDGNLQFTDSKGKEVILAPKEIASMTKQQQKVEDTFKKVEATIGTGDIISTTEVPLEEDKKKDLSRGPRSTTDPRFPDTSAFNNAHRRHQEFLFNLGSSDPKKFNQDTKPKLRILPVTAKIAEELGFPKEFAQQVEGEESTIRAVYITIGINGDPYVLGSNGQIIQKIDGSFIDPNKIVFSTLASTSLEYQGQERYTNKQNLDPQKVQEWQKAFREGLLSKSKEDMPVYQFSVSRGIPHIINQDVRNSVVEVGLISEKDLHKMVITIPTIGDVTIAALLNDEGDGIASDSTGVNMPAGVPLLNYGGNLIYLNNRHLTTPEVNEVFNLIIELAKRAQENRGSEDILDKDILKYLSRVLYFSSPKEGAVISDNQIWIDKTGLHIGKGVFPFFTTALIQNQDAIKDLIGKLYHNVNNYELNRVNTEKTGLEFNQLGMRGSKLEIIKTYPTYAHYLLNSDNPPLATNIAKPQGDEIAIVQKYSVLQVSSFDTKGFEAPKPKAIPPPKPAIPKTVTKKEEKTTEKPGVGTPLNEAILEFGLPDGRKIKYAQIFNQNGDLQSVRVISGIDAQGNEKQLPPNIVEFYTKEISEGLGITTETPQATIPPSAQEVKEATKEPAQLAPATEETIIKIIESQKQVQGKTPDEQFYIINGENYRRVTSVIPNDFDGDTAKYENSRIAGSTVDKMVREFFTPDALHDYSVPDKPEGMSQGAYDNIYNALKEVRKNINDKGEKFITSNIVLFDPINKIAGEVDILSVDKDGNFNIYDIKTAKDFSKYDTRYGDKLTKRENHTNQLSAYSNLFTNEFGITPKNLGILPFEISYDEKGHILTAEKQKGIVIQYDPAISELIPLTNTPTPKSAAERLLGHKAKPKDSQYRAVNVIPISYKKGDIKAEFAKAKEWLPDWVEFNEVQNIIHMTGGGRAWGALQDASIYVYKNAERGTTYHEAFELVWQNFLNPAQQLGLYNEFKERTDEFVTWRGEKKQFSSADFKEAKEQIAEEFMDYAQDNKLPVGQKQRNWFQKIVDFIKKIFLGSPTNINQLFKNVTSGYYKNYPASQKNIGSIEYRNIKASEAFIQDVLQGMTADLFSREFEKDSAIVTQLEENQKQATATIYGRLFNSMQYFFTSDNSDARDTLQAIYHDKITEAVDEGEQAYIIQEFEGLQNHWQFIKANWSEFVKEHQKYLRVFKVEFTIGDDGEVKMDSTSRRNLEDYENMTGQSDYARDIMTINARNAASEKVKLLFATIADREFLKTSVGETLATLQSSQSEGEKTRVRRENSQVRMPKLAPYAKVFNYVLHNVTNTNGIYDIYKKLVGMANNKRIKSNANVDALVNRLNFKEGFKNSSIDQAKMMLSVENALVKQKPDFVRQFVDSEGNVYFRTSIVNSRVDQVVEDWINAIKATKAVKTTPDGNFIFNKSVKDIKEPLDLLKTIGINIEKDDYGNLSPKDKAKFESEVNALRTVLEGNVGKKTPIFSTKQLGIDSRLNALASLYVDKVIGDDTDSMHFNLDGELTANFVLGNYASTILNDANNSKTREEFIAKNPQFKDIFHKDSILLNEILFDKDGKFTSPINIAVAEGRESAEGDNRQSSSLTEAERFVYEINNNLGGVFYTLLPADAKTEWAIYTGTYIKASEYFDQTTALEAERKFTERMWDSLQTEIALAKDFRTNPNRQNITELNKTYQGRTKGSSLRFFADILPKEMVDDIHNDIDKEVEGTSFDTAIFKDRFEREILKYIEERASKAVDYLAGNRIFGVSDKGNFKLNGILTDFIQKNLPKDQYHSREVATNLLKFREMNYVISNIEMHKFFFGDPAQYSDEMKRIKSFLSGREWSHVDYVQTAEGFNQLANSLLNRIGDIELTPEDPGYHNFKNHLNTITAEDIIVESSSLPLLAKTLGDEAEPYEEINEADSQTWQSLSSYRETLLKAGGRWTNAMEDQFQWEVAYERQRRSENGSYKYTSQSLERHDVNLMDNEPNSEVFFYITKPIHSGVQAVGDTAIMSLDKTSSAPLFYRMAEGYGMVGLYTAMQKKGTDYVRVISAHKVGAQTKSTIPFYNEEGFINAKGITEAEHELVPFKYYGIQVDTSSKKESQTEGSQLRKQAVGDLMSKKVPLDYSKDDWYSLSDAQKREASPIYRLVEQHDQALSALSNKRYQNLLLKLEARETDEGFEFADFKKVSDFILNEVTRRELPTNLSEAIEVNPDNPNEFRIPLEALSNYQQVRNILWSTIEKNIIRPKVSGGMKIQLSTTGWNKDKRIVKKMINGKPVYTSSDLKFYSVGEDGKTQKCEIYLPYWFGAKVRETLAKNGTKFKSDREFKDHILKYLNSTEDGKKLLSGIGFRIPTQRDNSIESFIVKDFLPEQMGDVIVLPSEITAKAGSDFDVDKLNTYLRNFFITKKGYPKAIPFEEINSNNDDQLKDYYEKYLLEKNRKYEQWFKEKSSRDFVDKVFGVSEEDQEPDYVPSLEEFMNQARGKSAWEMNSLEALENKYFDILEDIYSLPQKFKGLVSPNDASDLKNISIKINKLKDPNWSDTKQPYGRVLDSLWMMKERHKYLVGKKGVGIAAVGQTNLNVNQGSNIYINTSFQVRLPHNTVDINGQKYISLGAIKNQAGQDISKINASFIDGYVDIAKGAWIIDMGATDDTAKDFLIQTKWGTHPYDVALFMNQPAVQMYINERASRKSVSQINKQVQVLGRRLLYSHIASRFKTGSNKTLLDKSKPDRYTREQMEAMISKYGRGEALTNAEAKLQMQMLSDYQEIDNLGWELFRFVQGYNWDTSRNNDPNLVYKKNLQYEAALNSQVRSLDELMKTSFIGTIRDNVLKVDKVLRSITNTQIGEPRSMLNSIANDLAERRGVNQEEFRKAMLKAELSMLDYIMHTTTMVGGKPMNQWIQSLLLGNNSVAHYIQAMKDSGDINLSTNPFLRNLRANIDNREGFPSTIELVEKDHDSYTSNVLTGAMRELNDNQSVISLDDNPKNDLSVAQIYKRLVLASMLQSGSKRSSISFTHLIPNEHLSSLIKDSIQHIKANLDTFYENDIFYRTNWSDNTIVPTVSPTFYEDDGDPMHGRYVYESFNSNRFNTQLADQGIATPPKVLRLSPWEWGDKKVIKTVEYKRDPKTKQIIDRVVNIFRRVDIWNNNTLQPLILSRKEFVPADNKERIFSYVAFKQINKWGDGPRVQEYYDNSVQSILPGNPLIVELDDDLIAYTLSHSGFSTNLDEALLGEISEQYENRIPAEGRDEVADTQPVEEPIVPVETTKEIKFEEVSYDEAKRAGKKDIFPLASEGEVGEVEGYKVNIKSHPDLALYVYKTEYGAWNIIDSKSGRQVGHGDTAKGAISDGISKINAAIKGGQNIEILKALGINRSEEEDVLKNKDNGCKS